MKNDMEKHTISTKSFLRHFLRISMCVVMFLGIQAWQGVVTGRPGMAEEPASAVQDEVITGTVTDVDTGEPLPGVNVVLMGTTIGTATNMEGEYELSVPSLDETLVISYIGYQGLEVDIDGRTEINIELVSEAILGEELVVVGYGTQRAANITGSIARVNTEHVAAVTTPTVSQSLQGQTAGIFIKNMDGKPGSNMTEIRIRGFGEPLFIVDGMPVSQRVFEELDPNDIEEMNVLRDAASAATYGARAGNGVVLVQTKRGSRTPTPPQFKYTGQVSAQFFTENAVPDVVSSAEWMEMHNVVTWSNARPQVFSQEDIDLHRQHEDGSDPLNYPNVNMYQEVYRNYAPQTQHSLSVRGGTDAVTYYLSGGIYNQEGMWAGDGINFNRYTLRSNTDISLTDRLSASLDFSLNNRQLREPNIDDQFFVLRVQRWRPFYSIEPLSDPTLIRAAPGARTENPIGFLYEDHIGYNKWNRLNADTKIRMEYDLPYGFQTRAVFNYVRDTYDNKSYELHGDQYLYDEDSGEHVFMRQNRSDISLRQRNDYTDKVNFQYFLEWDQIFAQDHSLRGLLVYEYLSDEYERFDAWRLGYDLRIDQLFAGPETSQFNTNIARRDGRVGYIGRMSYNYAGRYSLEVSSRLDASPRFPSETRWGFFPSVSAAWTISEESFMRDLVFLTNLRLRASYGRLGFDQIGDFQYLATYSFSGSHIRSGTDLQRGIGADALPNPEITWEKMDIMNLGINFNLWSGLLDGTFDVFQRDRLDVLGSRIRDIPGVVGASMPVENYREYRTRGWEMMLNHSNNIAGEVFFRIGGNVSYHFEETRFIDEPQFINKEQERTATQIGRGSNPVWMYPSDGLFRSQEEIDNWPVDIDGRNNASIQVGDIKWVDYNGDGRITGADRYIVTSGSGAIRRGGDMPRLSFGINTSASWRSFDFLMLWQGATMFGYNLGRAEYWAAFRDDGYPLVHHRDDSFIPEGQPWRPANLDGKWPRLADQSVYRTSRSYNNNLDFWWVDGSYLRLRQIQLGYGLPTNLISAFGFHNFRITASGYNLWTITTLDFMDPEVDTVGGRFGFYYPQMRSVHMGIEVTF